MADRSCRSASWLLVPLLAASGCFAEPDPVADAKGSTGQPNGSSSTLSETTEPTGSATSWATGWDTGSTGYGSSSSGAATGSSSGDTGGTATTTGAVETTDDPGPTMCTADNECGGNLCCDVEGLPCEGQCVPDCNADPCPGDGVCRENGFCYPPCSPTEGCPPQMSCNIPRGVCEPGGGGLDSGEVPDG